MIDSIESIFVDDDRVVYVSAIVENMLQIRRATYYEPAEHGPALCHTSFRLSEDDVLPEDENELIKYLEELYLEWKIEDEY